MPWYTKTIFSGGQRPKSSSKVLFELNSFFTVTSIVVLNTQMYTIKLRSSKLIMKSDAQKHMVGFGFEHKIHDLKHFGIGFLFSYSLNSW